MVKCQCIKDYNEKYSVDFKSVCKNKLSNVHQNDQLIYDSFSYALKILQREK